MALSNAERQERYRQRLKAAARGDDLAERASTVIDAAFAAVWAVMGRGNWADIEDFPDVEAWKASFVDSMVQKHSGHSVEQMLHLFDGLGFEDATPEELAAMERARVLLEAVSLRHVKPLKKPKASRRGKLAGGVVPPA